MESRLRKFIWRHFIETKKAGVDVSHTNPRALYMTKFQSRSSAVESLVEDIGRLLSETHRVFYQSIQQLHDSAGSIDRPI
jgi:hypothetical protein